MDNVNDAIIFVHDITGNILFTVPEENYYIKNLKNSNLLSIIHPGQKDQALQSFSRSHEQGTHEYYLEITENEQEYHKYLVQSRSFLNGHQQLIHSHLFPVNHQSKTKFSPYYKYLFPDDHLKSILDKTNVPTILSHKTGRLIYCNQPALELLKIKAVDTHQYFAQDFYTDPASRIDFIKKLEKNQKSENIELKLKDNEGNFIWVLLKSRLILLHEEEVLLNNLMDISYQKEIEIQHSLTMERLELATTAAKIGIWEYDLLQQKVIWNENMYQLIDFVPEEDKLTFFKKITTENQQEQFSSFLYDQQESLVFDNQLILNGKEKYFQTTCQKYFNQLGELIKVLGVTIDITELQLSKKQIYDKLKDEALLADINTILNTAPDFKDSINQVIAATGTHLGVDRIAIYYYDKKHGSKGFLWAGENSEDLSSCNMTLADLQLVKEKVIYESYSAIPEPLKVMLPEAEKLKLCLFPLQIRDEQIGYVTFQRSEDKPWYNVKAEWIETIVNLISRAFEREEHQQEINRQQKLLRSITNTLTDVITQTNLEGIITYASPGWQDVMGFHPQEVIGKSAFNFIHPDDLPLVLAKFKKLSKTGTDSAQFRFLHKSGKFQWCDTRSSLVLSKDHQIEGIITGGYVIEERVKAEMALRNNEQKYRTLFEKAPIGVLLVDSEGNIHEINQALMETFNLKNKELQVMNVFHKSWLKKSPIFSNIDICIKSNETITGEEEYYREDGSVVIFKYYLNPLLIDGEITQVQAVLVDITQQKLAEEALKKNQVKLQQITTNITDLITEIDMNGIIIYASPSWEVILGYKPMDIIGSSIGDILLNTSANSLVRQIKRRAGNKRKKTFQHQMKSREGKIFWFESSGQPLLDDKNNKVGIVFGSSDITERKMAEQMLISQNEALRKANEELDSFVYRSSHDLKAPLTSVLGLINISRYSQDIPERNNLLLLMTQTISKLEKVIKQITDYSRNARLQLTLEEIDFNRIWQNLQEELSFLERFDEIDFKFKLHAQSCFYNDHDRISGVIKNLLANAIIYRSWKNESNWVHCTITVCEKTANIVIADNGTGIIDEQQDKIFNMFHRSSNISKGAGLGLYIVKETLQRINGTIEFNSIPGKGSTFSVTIPNLKK